MMSNHLGFLRRLALPSWADPVVAGVPEDQDLGPVAVLVIQDLPVVDLVEAARRPPAEDHRRRC